LPEGAEENGAHILDVAVERGFVTREQADEAIAVREKMAELGVPEELGNILVKKGFISDDQLKQLEARVSPKQPAMVGGFEIISRLGRGGMGAVYKARQVSMDRLVALKVLPPGLARDKNFIERFFREARAVARLNHPNIVQGIDVGVADKYYYFAMEYVDGETVQNRLARRGPYDEKEALEIVLQIAQGLHHAHRSGMVHRDVKPDNVMVTSGGVAKLCDLGLAKSMAGDLSITQSGLAVGTPHYISPEQARGEDDVDIRADIYSLGASLYHMVVGRTPYTGSSAMAVMTKHLNDDVPNPRDERPELSLGLVRLLEKMMAKEREDRYQTPEELIRDVNLVLSGKNPAALRLAAGRSAVRGYTGGHAARSRPISHRTTARPVDSVPHKKSPAMVVGIMAGLAVVAGLGALLAFSLRGGENGNGLPPPDGGNTGTGNTGNTGTGNTGTGNLDPEELKRQERLRVLTLEYESICRHWEKNPTDFVTVERRLQFLKDKAQGTSIKFKAEDKMREVRAKLESQGRAALKAAREKAAKLEDAGKLREAYECFNNLPLLPEVTDAAGVEQRRIKALAMSRCRAIGNAALEKLGPREYTKSNRGDLPAAEKHLETARALGFAEVDAAVDKALGELRAEHDRRTKDLEKRLAEAAADDRRKLELAFEAARTEIFGKAAEVVTKDDARLFGFAAAGAAAKTSLLDPKFKSFAAEAGRIVRDLDALEKLQAALPGKARARVGQFLELEVPSRTMRGTLAEVKGMRLGIRPRGMPAGARTYAELTELKAKSLAELVGMDLSAAADAYRMGIVAFYAGRKGESVDLLRAAAKDARLKADAEYYLGFALAAWKQGRESEAQALYDECLRTYKRLKDANVPRGNPQWATLTGNLE
jgi:serine/threonine-protein kinase